MMNEAWFRWAGQPVVGMRFGKQAPPSFIERYGGTRGIPKRHWHLFGGWLTFMTQERRRHA